MNNLIECYVYDVIRRLPERERQEIGLELEASISDMLPNNPSSQDINTVLQSLGPPRLLAEKYRQNPQYLISPALFDTYLSTLKAIVSVVSGICGVIGILTSISSSAFEIVVNGLWLAANGSLQAALWVTLSFVVAEKFGYKPDAWKPEDLPPVPNLKAEIIPRSASIAGMALSLLFTGAIIASISRGGWFFIVWHMDGKFINFFSQAALNRAIPFVALIGCVGFAANALNLYCGRWNIPTCLANIAYNIIFTCVAAHILFWPDLVNESFTESVAPIITAIVGNTAVADTPYSNSWHHYCLAIIIIISIIDIGSRILKTWKGARR